jgi:ankyrin repeat protein
MRTTVLGALFLIFSIRAVAAPRADLWFDSAKRGDLVQIKKLSAHTPVDTASSSGETALILASEAGFVNIVEFLISKKANLNLQDKAGNSALVYSISNGFDDVSLLLIKHGADVSAASNREGSALKVAAKSGRDKIVEVIVGAHPELLNKVGADGETPLFSAIRAAHFALAEKMIGLGSKIDFKNSKGQSALDVAKASGVPEGHTLLKKLVPTETVSK